MQVRLSEIAARLGLDRAPTPVIGVAIAVCVAIAVAGFARWGPVVSTAQPPGSPETSRTVDSAREEVETPRDAGQSVEPTATVWVHLVGAVFEPGVYRVVEGARMVEALRLAGGMTGNAAPRAVNLARRVVDGEQVYVPTQDEWARAGAEPDGLATAAALGDEVGGESRGSGPVDVNTADTRTLETLPGIGPATAAKIVADRAANGPFRTIDELLRVSGIGEAKLDAIRDLVTVG